MEFQQELQLQKLGIIHWDIRRPIVLKKEIVISLPAHVKLVIITNKPLILNESLISDVLHAIKITSDQVLQITPDRITMLPTNNYYNSWQIGLEETISIKGSNLISPDLGELQINPDAKSNLWKQICDNEDYFFFKS